MRPEIYWIDLPKDGRLAIMPRPRANDWLEDEIAGWRSEGVEIVVSLLEPEEISNLGLQDEERLCRAQGLEFISFPIPDRGVPPSTREATNLVHSLASAVAKGKSIAIHCRAGIGRSSVILACTLVIFGFNPEAAFNLIGRARGMTVPDTDLQTMWVAGFATKFISDCQIGERG